MQSIKLRRHVGQDGILHLDIPVGITEQEFEVMIIYQSVSSSSRRSLEQFYGICADDPIMVDDQGISEALDDELAEAFN